MVDNDDWHYNAQCNEASLRAEVERLTRERDKAREDCGFQRGLKESIREEFYAFIRLKAALEGGAK